MRPSSCDQWTVAELTWYFGEFDAEIGIRAFDPDGLHGRMLEPDDRAFKAVRRAREVEKALRAIPWRHQRVLGLVYEPHRWPAHVVALFGSELAGIVCACDRPKRLSTDPSLTLAWAHGRYEGAHRAFVDAAQKAGARIE